VPSATPSATDPSAWIELAAREYPQRLFLVSTSGRSYSYQMLKEMSGKFAAALLARGVAQGDRVAVQVDKSPEALLLYVACLRIGAVYVPINVANTATEVGYFIGDAQPRVVVVRPQARAQLEPVAARARVAHLETLGTEGDGSLADLAQHCTATAAAAQPLAPDTPAAIVYTSGTTGRSKGATLTRANLASNAATLAACWRFTAQDVLLHTLPLFHVHGLFVATNTVLASGSAMLLLPKFEAAAVLQHLPQATVLMGVPTHYTRLLQDPGLTSEATAHMRLFVSGSASLLAETHREFMQRTGQMILERYGMTETLMNTSNPYAGERVPGSVGPPLPGVALRVTDSATGAVASQADVLGTLEVRGPNVFAGYWGDPARTRSEFTLDGWFKTGDLGRIDPKGYVFIMGRVKDVVISGGYNVYPKEIELELDALPGVLESAVFGVPHPDFGEGVTAAVVLQPGSEASEAGIIQALRSRLAAYKLPKRVLLLAELPRNAMGKVQKTALRATHASLYRG
jgi:malonyl-CoA/methylmalonyl-CoA synthetase